MRQERRALVLGLLLSILLARAMRALLSSVFFESLDTLRLNATAAWTAVLLAPLVAPVVGARGLRLAIVVGGAASALLPLARFTSAYLPVAALATGALLLAAALVMRREGAMPGLVAGLALEAAFLLLGGSHDPTLAAWSIAPGLLATALAAVLALRVDTPSPPASWLAGGGLAALVAVDVAFLASPFAAARWLALPAWGAALAGLGGLVAGATLVRRVPWPAWVIAGIALADVALLRSPAVALSLAMVQLMLGVAAVRLAPHASPAAFGLVLAPLLFALLFFRDPLGLAEWSAIVPILAILAALAALRRTSDARRSWWPAPAIVALVLIAAIPGPAAEAPEGREITVVTWNVHQAFGNRGGLDPEIYADVLRSLDADVILLQESDTARLSSGGIDVVRYLADELGMHAAYAGGVGPAILSRFPFVAPTNATPEWSLETAIEVDGTRVALRSVHFARNGLEREEQARELVAAPPGPTILGGDFNLFGSAVGTNGAQRDPYAILTSRYEDAWIESGHAMGDPSGNTFRLPEVRRRIDIVFLDGIEALSADRVLDERTRAASDHLPVVARLRVP